MAADRVTLKEACRITGLSKRALYSTASHDHTFPVMIRLPNGGGIVFDADEIDAWVRANPVAAATPQGVH